MSPHKQWEGLDDLWNWHKQNNRALAGSIYNGFKFLPAIRQLAGSECMMNLIKGPCGFKRPALLDINCRIDSLGEERFLFDWHQDYWFSVSSTNAIVVWIPITELEPTMGGLELISNIETGGKIFKTRAGGEYITYADAVKLDEPIPECEKTMINQLSVGDAVVFKFNALHRSIPVKSPLRSRFTVQLRFVDFEDPQFLENKFRPGAVNSKYVEY